MLIVVPVRAVTAPNTSYTNVEPGTPELPLRGTRWTRALPARDALACGELRNRAHVRVRNREAALATVVVLRVVIVLIEPASASVTSTRRPALAVSPRSPAL